MKITCKSGGKRLSRYLVAGFVHRKQVSPCPCITFNLLKLVSIWCSLVDAVVHLDCFLMLQNTKMAVLMPATPMPFNGALPHQGQLCHFQKMWWICPNPSTLGFAGLIHFSLLALGNMMQFHGQTWCERCCSLPSLSCSPELLGHFLLELACFFSWSS